MGSIEKDFFSGIVELSNAGKSPKLRGLCQEIIGKMQPTDHYNLLLSLCKDGEQVMLWELYSIPYDVQEGRTLLAAAEKYWQALQGVVYCVEECETDISEHGERPYIFGAKGSINMFFRYCEGSNLDYRVAYKHLEEDACNPEIVYVYGK